MNTNIASARALGFGVLAMVLWMFYTTHAGLVSEYAVDATVMRGVLTMAAIGLLIAGLAAFLRNESWLAFFFLLWAGLAWGAVLGAHHGTSLYNAWFYIVVCVVNLYLWLATIKNAALGRAISVTVLALWVSWLLMALSVFCGVDVLDQIGGIVGLVAAALAFYVSGGTLARARCAKLTLPGIAAEAD